MRTAQLLKRNLTYYWRTNLTVVLGVATAVTVLAGALLVGDSVRASLRDLFLQRLGNTDQVVTATGFLREQLASEIQNDERFAGGGLAATCPLISLTGTVTLQDGQRAADVRVYGVDERFWEFHGSRDKARAPRSREVLVSEGLARELGSQAGDSLLLRVEKPSEIPVETLHSRKEDLGRTLRLTVRETLAADALGEFSVQPQQGAIRAVFIPLALLQKELEQEGKVNTILISRALRSEREPETYTATTELVRTILRSRTALEDFGIKLRALNEQQTISLEHDSRLLSDALADTARTTANDLSLRVAPVFSYLANSISSKTRSIPYSLITALDKDEFEKLRSGQTPTSRRSGVTASPSLSTASGLPPIILNEWAARDLGVSQGEPITLEYYLWREDGRLETKKAQFQLTAIVPIEGMAADKNLVPDYPGITGSENLSDWDPPFPVDLKLVRRKDEDYWHQFRTTPKAFIPLVTGQELWASRFGKLTSLRLTPGQGSSLNQALIAYQQHLQAALDPARMGISVMPARAQGLEASQGATDFGEYFLYFSFFLVVAALLLTALFFKLGVEQRLRELGILQAVGFPASRIRKQFLMEGTVLAVIGSAIGLVGAVGYGQLMMMGLRTWWVDAVGTTMLKLHVASLSLLLGGLGGIGAALVCIAWTLRRLGRESTRSLLTGTVGRDGWMGSHGELPGGKAARLRLFSTFRVAIALSLLGLLLLLAASMHLVPQVSGFFVSGTLWLTAFLCYQAAWLRHDSRKAIHGTGWWPLSRLGFRNTTYRPGRSVLCIALIASAAFTIVAVDTFRRRSGELALDKKSGNGGFPLLAESLLPLVHDPNTLAGQEALNLREGASPLLAGVNFMRFRIRPGDDASCLNLYQPHNPRIIAPTENFIQSNRFTFQNSLASSRQEEENPWLLLNREYADGSIPVIADANSMTYVLHLKLGDELILNREDGPIRLRVVGALADSIFQSELLMSEGNFLRVFPEQEGYRFFLIDLNGTPRPEQSKAIAATLEDRLSDFGFDVAPTDERLANFHRVENTYLSTFQMLGGLGLILGTVGMAAVLLRNVLERRRELALLRAVGYNSSDFTLMIIAENALLLFCGLVTGTVCALLAIAPVFLARRGQLPGVALGLLLLGVLVSGLTASLLATWSALRSPLLPALRAE